MNKVWKLFTISAYKSKIFCVKIKQNTALKIKECKQINRMD